MRVGCMAIKSELQNIIMEWNDMRPPWEMIIANTECSWWYEWRYNDVIIQMEQRLNVSNVLKMRHID